LQRKLFFGRKKSRKDGGKMREAILKANNCKKLDLMAQRDDEKKQTILFDKDIYRKIGLVVRLLMIFCF
jgi:hypothetical protein